MSWNDKNNNNNNNNNNNSSWTSPPQWAKENPTAKDNNNNSKDDDDDQQQQQQQQQPHAASTSSFSWSAWAQQTKDTFSNKPRRVASWDSWVDQNQKKRGTPGPIRPSNDKIGDISVPVADVAASSTLATNSSNSINNKNNNNNTDKNQQKQQPTSTIPREQQTKPPSAIDPAKVNSWDNWVKQQTVSSESHIEGWITPRQAAAERADEKRKQDEAQQSWMAKILLRRQKLQAGESDANDEIQQKQPYRVMQHPHFIQRILKYTKITDYRVPIKLAHVSSSWEETIWHFGTVHLIWKKIFQASVEEVADDTIRSAKLKINQLHWKRKKEYYYKDVSGGKQRKLNKNHDGINKGSDDDSAHSDDGEDDDSDDSSIHGDDRDKLRTVIRELQRAKRRTNSTLAIDTTQAMHRSTYKRLLTTSVLGLDTLFSPDVNNVLKHKKYGSKVALQIDERGDKITTAEQRKERFQAIDADFYGEISCKRRLFATYPVPPSTDAIAHATAVAEKKAKEKALKKAGKTFHADRDDDNDDESSDDDDVQKIVSDQYRDAVFSWCPPFALWNCRIDAARMIPKLVELRHGFGERILLEGFFHEAFPDCRRYDANADKKTHDNSAEDETRTGNEHDEEVIFQRLLAEQQLKKDELSNKEKLNDDDASSDDDASATSSSNSSSIPAFVGQESIFIVNVEAPEGSSINLTYSRRHHATKFGIIRAFLSALRSEPEIVPTEDESENNNNSIDFLPAAVPHVSSSSFTPTSSMKTRNRCRLPLVKAIHQKLIEISSSDRFDAEKEDNGDIVLFPSSEYTDENQEEDEEEVDKEKKEKKKPLVNFFTHNRMKNFCAEDAFQRGGYIFTSINGQSSLDVFEFLVDCAFKEFLWNDRTNEQKKKFAWSSWSSSSASKSDSAASKGKKNNSTINNNNTITTKPTTSENTTKAEFLASIISHPEICLGTPSDPFSFSAEIRKNLGDSVSSTTTIDPLLCSALSGNVEIFEHILTTYPLLQQRFMFGSYDTLVKVFLDGPALLTTQQSRFTVKPYPFTPLSSYSNNKDNDGYAVSTEPRAPSREQEAQKRRNQETMTAVFNSTRTNPYITLTFLKLVDLLERDIHKTVRDANDRSKAVADAASASASLDKQTQLDSDKVNKLSAAAPRPVTSSAGMTRQILHYSSLLDPLFDENNARNDCSTNSSTTSTSTSTSRQQYKNEMLLLDNSHYKRRIAQFQRVFDRIVDLAFQHDKRPELAMEPLFWREPLIAILLRLDPLISSQWVSAAQKFRTCSSTTSTATTNNRDNDAEPTDSKNNTKNNSSNVFNRNKHKLPSSKADNTDKAQSSTEMHEKFINFKVLRESVIVKLLNRLPLQTLVNCVIDLTKQFSNVCPTLQSFLQSTNGNTSTPSSSKSVEERFFTTVEAFEGSFAFAATDIDTMERACGFRTHIENKEPGKYDQVLLQQQIDNSALNNVNTTTSSSLWPMSKKVHFERRDPPREVSHLLLRLYRFLVNRLSKHSTEQEKAEVFDLSPSSINPLVQIFSSEYLNWNTLILVQIFFKHGKANPFVRRNLPQYPIHCESTSHAFFNRRVINSMIPCYRDEIIDQVGRFSLLHLLITNVRFFSAAEKIYEGTTCFCLSSAVAAADPASQRLVLRHNSMIHAQFLLEFIRLKYGEEKLQEYMIMPTEIEMNTPCHLGVMHFRPEILFVIRHQFRAPKINFSQLNKNGLAPLDCHIYGEQAHAASRNNALRKLLSKMIEEGEDAVVDRTVLSLLDDRVAIRFHGTKNTFIHYSSVFINLYRSMTKTFDDEVATIERAEASEKKDVKGRADDDRNKKKGGLTVTQNGNQFGGGVWIFSSIYYKW